MKRTLTVSVCYPLALFLIPFLTSNGMHKGSDRTTRAGWGDTTKVYNHKTGKVMLLDSFNYVVGVRAAEVSPRYEPEALKANAVATYTYAMRKKEYTDAHPGYAEKEHSRAHVCTNYAHCKS